MPSDTSELLHGTLDVLVLKTLSRGPVHGYGISRWIEEQTKNELEIVDAALYKALHRLEERGPSRRRGASPTTIVERSTTR